MGRWVGGWVVEKVKEDEAVLMRCCMYGLGRWVGGRRSVKCGWGW